MTIHILIDLRQLDNNHTHTPAHRLFAVVDVYKIDDEIDLAEFRFERHATIVNCKGYHPIIAARITLV